MKSENTILGEVLIVLITSVIVVVLFIHPPIEQSLMYHNFSDSKRVFEIPNFWNVLTNVPFLLVGFLGLLRLKVFAKDHRQYLIFFVGVILVSVGSGYYHLNPSNDTLVWDRLPMTIAFMTLLSILISEFIGDSLGRKMLLPLLGLGLGSILWWVLMKDLRLYVIVQFVPILIIPILLIFFRSQHDSIRTYWFVLIAYLAAKILEHFDSFFYEYFRFSGHSLKHLVSAVALFKLYLHYKKRQQVIGQITSLRK